MQYVRNCLMGLRYGLLTVAVTVILLLCSSLLPAHPNQATLETSPIQWPDTLHASQDSLPPSFSDLLQQGRNAYQSSRYEAALALWQQAAAQLDYQDPLNYALTLSYLSLAQQALGHLEAATATIDQAEFLLRQQTSPIPDELWGQVLNTHGSLLYAQGQIQTALDYWVQAEAAYAEADEIERQLGTLLNQAQAQQDLGSFLLAQRRLQTAETWLSDRVSPADPLQVLGRVRLGRSLHHLGNLDASQQILREALALAQQHHHSQFVSTILLSLGNALRAQGNPESALDYYQQAADQADTSLKKTQAALNQLSLWIETGELTAASQLLSTLRDTLKDLPLHHSALYVRIQFGQQAIALSSRLRDSSETPPLKPADIAADLQAVVRDAHQIADVRAEAYGLGYLGHLYEIHQQWAEAEQLTIAALQKTQSLNAADITYQWQWQLGRIQKIQGETVKAVSAYQTAFQSLQSLRSDLAAINPNLQFSFRESVEPLYREFVDLLLQVAPSSDSPQTPLQSARNVMEALQLAELSDFFRSACLAGQVVALEQVAPESAAVIYPILLSDRLAIIVSLPGQPLHQYSTAISQDEVEATLTQFRRRLNSPYTDPRGKVLGQQLYDWLIRPMASDLAVSHIETLAFVLDGALRNVPMAALYDGDQYLLEQYSLALTPGLQLLSSRPLTDTRIGVLAAGLAESRHGFGALINVASELENIQSVLPSEVLINQAFTVEKFQTLVREFSAPIVHLATHGQFSSKAEETFVLAWDRPINIKELSTILRAGERTRTQPIELLVLSACQTADGDNRAALGLAGIAVQAGARSTVASLWNLHDESAAAFMEQFYAALGVPNLSRAEALRQAQLALLQDPNYRHPIHWAPYVLVGNWL